MNLTEKQKEIPDEFKELAKEFGEKGFITTSLDNLVNWEKVNEEFTKNN